MAETDPRHRGFGFQIRPGDKSPAAPRRGIAGAAPPKPTLPPPAPTLDVPAVKVQEHPVSTPPPPVETGRTLDLPRNASKLGRLGSPRHNMVYVQFQVSPTVSDLLTQRAIDEDVVLGEVVISALRAFQLQSGDPVRRRRKGSTASRRSVLVRPAEADEIKTSADKLGYTPSALIRAALEQYLR